MTTQRLNLSIIPGGMKPILNVSQYDKGQTWIFTLFEGSTTYSIPAGSVVTIAGTKKDNTGFQYPCTYSGATVTAIEEQQMTIFPGDVQAELRISNGDELVATINFVIRVEAAALKNDVLISDTELPLIEEAAEVGEHIDEWKAEIEGYAEDSEAYALGTRGGVPVSADDPAYHNNAKYYAANTEELISDAWDDTTAYVIDDYAIEDNKLYRCIQANTNIQPPSAAYWVEVNVGEELARIQASAGVTSFNTRTGAVTPQASDYDADQVDYDHTTSGLTATDVQGAIDEIDGSVDAIEKNTKHLTNAVLHDFAPVLEIDAYGVDAGDVKVKIEPVQSGSGDPSPSNPRPISGWAKVNIQVNGVNQWDEQWELGNIYYDTGAEAPSTTTIRTVGYINVVGGRQYYVKSPGNIGLRIYAADYSYIGNLSAYNSVVTMPANAKFLRFIVANTTTYANNISINYPATDTDYHPFVGGRYTIDLGGTRYGGMRNVTTGGLMVTLVEADMGDITWSRSATYPQGGFYVQYPQAKSGISRLISSGYLYDDSVSFSWGNFNTLPDKRMYKSSGNDYIYVKDTDYNDATLFTNAVRGMQLVYELATPITVQLSPTAVKLLQGNNNLSADSGDISVDVFSLVESVSRVEDKVAVKVDISALGTNESGNATASRAYSQGEYFYKDGKMYKCLAAIAQGAAFTVGTNCDETTLFAELTAALA